MKKFLIVKTSALGDILHAFNAVHILSCYYPDAQIDWVVEKQGVPLLEKQPFLHKVLVISSKTWKKGQDLKQCYDFFKNLRKESYDVVFDLQGNFKSGLVTLFSKAKRKIGFSLKMVQESINIFCTKERMNPPKGKNVREDLNYLIKNFCEKEKGVLKVNHPEWIFPLTREEHDLLFMYSQYFQNKKGRRILICLGSHWPSKRLPKKNVLEFLRHVSQEEKSFFVFLWGTEEEKQYTEEIAKHFFQAKVLEKKYSLAFLQNLMQKMDCIISMDSLPLHLAGMTNTPIFSVFGPSKAEKYLPLSSKTGFFQGKCPYQSTFEKRCPKLRNCPDFPCMSKIDSNKLFEAFSMHWKKVYK